MFNEHQSPRRQFDPKLPSIVLACGGGGLVLSFGLCGAASAIPGRATSIFAGGLGMSGMIVFFLSILAVVVGIVWLLGAAVMNAFRR